MRVLRRLSQLDRSDRALLARGLLWVVGARVGLAVSDFQRLRRTLDRASARLPLRGATDVDRVRWAVTAAARRVPGTHCLAWALALRGLLAQAGITSELRIGVAKSPGGRLDAHAWVDCQGAALSWGDDVENYAALDLPLPGDP